MFEIEHSGFKRLILLK